MASRHAFLVAAALVGAALAGCSSNRPSFTNPATPPYPAGAEDGATYCLVWVPPTYRDVPDVVCCKPGKVCAETRCVKKIEFDEVVKPGCYEDKCSPCRTRDEAVVQCSPGSDRWVPTTCPCTCGQCYRHERTPPTYKICDKTVTEAGVAYCAYKEPEYDVVPRVKTCKEKVEVYKPAEYGVTWHKELFQEGHWVWQKTNCPQPQPCGCAPKPAPRRACGCAGRPGFETAPGRD